MNGILQFIGGVFFAIGSFFAPHAVAPTSQILGVSQFSPIQTQSFFLSGSGITNNATTVILTAMNYPSGQPVAMSDIGSIGYATIEPGTSREEQVSFTGIIQETNGSALLQNVTRGLAFNPGTQGCNGSSTLSIAHAGGTQFVLSNTACFYQQFAIIGNTTTITGAYTFQNAPTILTTSTASSAAVTYAQLASTSFAGTVNASVSQKGIIQEATPAQIASGTGVGSTGADLVIPNRDSCLTESTTPCSVIASGTIDPSFLLGGNYSIGSLVSASTTLNGITNASSVILSNTLSAQTVSTTALTVAGNPVGTFTRTVQVLSANITVSSTNFTVVQTTTLPAIGTGTVYEINGSIPALNGLGVKGSSTITFAGYTFMNCSESNSLQVINFYLDVQMLNSTTSFIGSGYTSDSGATCAGSFGSFQGAFTTSTPLLTVSVKSGNGVSQTAVQGAVSALTFP